MIVLGFDTATPSTTVGLRLIRRPARLRRAMTPAPESTPGTRRGCSR